ncbi:MAG TPA: hypothetical protein VIL88_00290 [Devosia sp.]|uniref:hypothetical protein n=1 Tax=Devosia sp. TaxID=1871048 RepID=UPI002F91FE56
MATIVRLTQAQIDQLLAEAEDMEVAFKDMHAELSSAGTAKDTLARFGRLHDRFTSAITFLKRQRELGGSN